MPTAARKPATTGTEITILSAPVDEPVVQEQDLRVNYLIRMYPTGMVLLKRSLVSCHDSGHLLPSLIPRPCSRMTWE